MPPSGHPLQFNSGPSTSKKQELYYTDYDVELLHQIVIKAQNLLSPKVLPTNALFTAYFTLLEQREISPEHDDRYARVLFKICTLRGPETLLEKFEDVLYQMGIGVEFYHPRRKEEDDSDPLKDQHSVVESFTKETEKKHFPHTSTPKRRNSENSMWDLVVGESSQLQKRRINSFSSIPHHKAEFEAEKDSTQIRLDFLRFKNESFFTRPPKFSNTQRIRAWLTLESLNSRNRSFTSLDGSPTDKEIKKLLHSQQNQTSFPASTDFHITSLTTPLSSLLDEETAIYSFGSSPNEILPKSETLLDIRARMVFNRRLALRIKSMIQAWKTQAKKLHSDNLRLNVVATNQYSKTALPAVFKNWRIGVQEKRKSKQISRYYKHLKKCAARARNLYLLYVAFSHWSNFTTERIQLTAKTRKRIIQTRIFNAWRDITAVDELKVKHQILKMKFSIWKLRYISAEARRNAAKIRYNTTIIQKYFSVWKRMFLYIRMITWRTYRSIHIFLVEWNFKSQSIRNQQCDAETFRQNNRYLNVINPWVLQFKKLIIIKQKAELFYVSKVNKNIFFKWSKELTIKKFQNQIHCRQTKRIFLSWLHQTREERRAIATDRIKILREAWTNWRHRTRTILFRSRSDNFIIEQTIYIWILRARSNLAIRLRDENYLRDMIYKWNLKSRTPRKHHQSQEILAREILWRKRMNFVLRQWYSRMGILQEHRMKALDLYEPQFLKSLIRIWVSYLQHLQKLDRWSQDAGYYLLTSRVMKRWKISTERAKRNKRKNAFIIVRRKIKINILRRVLRIWKEETQEILNKHSWATEINQNRIYISLPEIFHYWHRYAKELLVLKKMWQEKSLHKHFAIWLYKTKHVLALGPEAIIIYQEKKISKILQKWCHYSSHIRAYENPAYEIFEKNFRKHKRRMFIYWRDRVKFQKVASTKVLPDPDLEEIAQNEAWSEFGEETNNKKDQEERNFDRDVTPSSIPAYLNTPSKQSERIKAALAKNSNTPITPSPMTQDREFRVTRTGGLFSSIQRKRLNNLNISVNNNR